VWVRIPPAALDATAEDVVRVRQLASYGLDNSQIARLTGVWRTTVRDGFGRLRSGGHAGVCSCGHEPHGGRGREISIARAASVARLGAFVGPNS
jgi:hypothetical protein